MQTDSASLIVYGTAWRPDCRRAKQFLSEHRIQSAWADIRHDEAALAAERHVGCLRGRDVRAGSTNQAASAAGDGATVAVMIREYLHGQ